MASTNRHPYLRPEVICITPNPRPGKPLLTEVELKQLVQKRAQSNTLRHAV